MEPYRPEDSPARETEGPPEKEGKPEIRLVQIPAHPRHFDLDALRAVLMVLGVFLHAAYVYSVGLPWKVNSPDGSPFFTGMIEAIHAFRMPGFFILSGFFAFVILKRHGSARFLQLRMRRLVIPMLSAAVLLNSLEAYLLQLPKPGGENGLAAYLASAAFLRHWTEGEWVGHLWFLIDVAVYSLALAAAMALFSRGLLKKDRGAAILRRIPRRGGLLFLFPMANLGVLSVAGLSPVFYERWGGFLQLKELLEFLPFFAFGALLYASPSLMKAQLRFRRWHIPCLVIAVAARRALRPLGDSLWGEAALLYLSYFMVWVSCVLLFAAFKALLNRPHRAVARFSDASYSIYLFHHVCIVALGTAFLGLNWNIYLEFSLLAGATMAGTFAIHHFLIMRFAPLRFLFNGKPLRTRARSGEILRGNRAGTGMRDRKRHPDSPTSYGPP